MKRSNFINQYSVFFAIVAAVLVSSCKHEPFLDDIHNPIDTTGNPIDTTGNPVDTTDNPDTLTNPCLPGVIYFERDVLPILSSNCAVPGCHDPITASDDNVFISYQSTMATDEVDPGRPGNSDLYENLIETDPDKRMPPPSSGITLTPAQINIIRDWIAQGAKNLTCSDSMVVTCDTVAVSFSADITSIVNTHCKGCHSGTSPQAGINLTTHAGVMVVVNDGRLLPAVTHSPGVTPMPLNQPKISECKISKIRAWINSGSPNN